MRNSNGRHYIMNSSIAKPWQFRYSSEMSPKTIKSHSRWRGINQGKKISVYHNKQLVGIVPNAAPYSANHNFVFRYFENKTGRFELICYSNTSICKGKIVRFDATKHFVLRKLSRINLRLYLWRIIKFW